MPETFELVKSFHFEAAHALPMVPEGHPCARIHGHSYRVEIALKGALDPHMGWVMDYGVISEVLKPIIDKELDHRLLNEVPGLENPTSELLALWLWHRVFARLPQLHRITVAETCSSQCNYYGPERSSGALTK
ncbi:6-carboxytetrahydropterin synthase QueD [Anthocerotibacter panamensis]|uniref:6-carboxytetrahydropterin synthase QueD n=1 Tax=Anthocerotibacter panamensis TaxID=2857077 RepID=UPI001C4048DD|nr:6-carboxytetrahydropterin synthase QueD [Anthocerotibacter panamensis]